MYQIVVVLLLIFGMVLLLPRISKALSGHRRLLNALKFTLFGAYIVAYLYETVLFRTVKATYQIKTEFLWSYRMAFAFHEGIAVTDWPLLIQILLNILLFVPLGYLIPFVWPNLREGFPFKSVILIGFVCSCLTEIAQLVLKIGLFEFDDILNNSVGCLLGYYLFWRFQDRKG